MERLMAKWNIQQVRGITFVSCGHRKHCCSGCRCHPCGVWWLMLALFHRSQHGVDGDELRVAPRLMVSGIACSEGMALAFYISSLA